MMEANRYQRWRGNIAQVCFCLFVFSVGFLSFWVLPISMDAQGAQTVSFLPTDLAAPSAALTECDGTLYYLPKKGEGEKPPEWQLIHGTPSPHIGEH